MTRKAKLVVCNSPLDDGTRIGLTVPLLMRGTVKTHRGPPSVPIFPLGPCRFRRCRKRGEYDGFCDEHRKQRNREYDRVRQSDPTYNFYKSIRWRRLRRAFLAANPLCQTCEHGGNLTIASVVDHKIPIKQGGASLDWENLQSQCASCHARKSVLEGSRWPRR